MAPITSTLSYGLSYPAYQFQEINGGVLYPITKNISLTPSTNNQLVVTAVVGEVIRVLDLIATSGQAISTSISLKSPSGGTAFFAMSIPSNASVPPSMVLEEQFSGWGDTSVSQGLYADIGASDVRLTIKYITFTPTA